MDKLTIDNFKSMINKALVDVTARADEFSALDAVCGDGDHGTAIVEALKDVLTPEDYLEAREFFRNEDKDKRIALLPDYTFWGWNTVPGFYICRRYRKRYILVFLYRINEKNLYNSHIKVFLYIKLQYINYLDRFY